MRKRNTHSTITALLVIANVFVVALFFNAYLDSKNVSVRDTFSQMGSAVGMSAGVRPNEWNSVAQEMTEWERDLTAREKAVAEQEALIAESTSNANQRSATYIIAISALLLALIIMNFVLDWRRAELRSNRSVRK